MKLSGSSLVQSCQPPGSATICTNSRPLYVDCIDCPTAIKDRLICQAVELKWIVHGNSSLLQTKYKQYRERNVLLHPIIALVDYFFEEFPVLTIIAAKRLAIENHSKHRPIRLRPYQVITFGFKFIIIMWYSVKCTVSTNRVAQTTQLDGNTKKNVQYSNKKVCNQAKQHPLTALAPKKDRKYGILHIVCPIRTADKNCCELLKNILACRMTLSSRLKIHPGISGSHTGSIY